MKLFTIIFSLALFIIAVPPAQARPRSSFSSSGDMFYDQNWVYDRPAVPSDREHRGDMFAPIPPMYHQNADLFARAQPLYTYGREDMFPHHAFGPQHPYHTLTIDPPQGVYNAR